MIPEVDLLRMHLQFGEQQRKVAPVLGGEIALVTVVQDVDGDGAQHARRFLRHAHDVAHGGLVDLTGEADVVTMTPQSVVGVRRPVHLRVHVQSERHHVGGLAHQRAHGPRVVHHQLLVGIDVQHPLGGDGIEGDVARGREVVTPWLVRDAGSEGFGDGHRVVGASGVDHHDLVAELPDRTQTTPKMLGFVLDDDRRRDQRTSNGHLTVGIVPDTVTGVTGVVVVVELLDPDG
ncbi:unannotated protein [freshwater metagenome]|uniref:Unannotated protein n=1 Tax=freshwater metagenome TaxID=449393 RepID=A0A6J6FEM9_9ZZZZ